MTTETTQARPPEYGGATCSDLRSPLAKARDDWMLSDDGEKATDTGILFSPHHAQYLRNRVESAWLAGARWGMDHPNKVIQS